MFDRYLGDNTSVVPNHEKLYKRKDGTVYLPALNIMSFLSATQSRSAPRVYYPVKSYKDKAAALLGSTIIEPAEIDLTRNGEPIVWTGEFDEDMESGPSGIWLHKAVARVKGNIPNPKERPTISAPWEASFDVTLFDNNQVKPDEFKGLVVTGMAVIGLGTFRGVFGKATVEWE